MIFEGTKNQFFFGLGLTRAGISVPDAVMLDQMAELFEVPVSVLLGGGPEVTEQSSELNEIA